MSSEPVHVLAHCQSKRTLEQAFGDLWRKVEAVGWFAAETPRVLVQVGQRWRSALVVETARSLARLLADQAPAAQIEILDAGAQANGVHADDEAAPPTQTVSGIVAAEVRIPEWWFESRFLVTVTGAGPAAAGRISAVLDAQAEPLHHLRNALRPASLAYEAHRLFASDLVVACASVRRNDPTSEACWFAGSSDIAVEMALMRASGCEPSHMPYVKMLMRHETLPELALDGMTPRINGYLAPEWQARGNAIRMGFGATRRAALQDVRSFRRNLWRLRIAVRRRLANWKRRSE